jgi:hypothetical protein
MTAWTGDRKRIKPEPKPKKRTLVTTPLLFAKRDRKEDIVTDGPCVVWSLSMLKQASEKWEEVLVFCDLMYAEDLSNLVKIQEFTNIMILTFEKTCTDSRTQFMKECLIERGAKIITTKNPREVTYLNIKKYINAPHFTWARADDHDKVGIDLDKPKSFKELQSERKTKATW